MIRHTKYEASLSCSCQLAEIGLTLDRLVLARLGTTSLHILNLMKSKSMPITLPPSDSGISESPLGLGVTPTEIDAKGCVSEESEVVIREPEGIASLSLSNLTTLGYVKGTTSRNPALIAISVSVKQCTIHLHENQTSFLEMNVSSMGINMCSWLNGVINLEVCRCVAPRL